MSSVWIPLLKFLVSNTVAALAILCVPISGIFLWIQKEQLNLNKTWKLLIAPFVYVLLGLLSLAVFSVLHDIRTFPNWSIHHQGLLLVFPLLFPLAAKVLHVDCLTASDALAVSLPGIIAVLRIFCLVRGCCYGEFIFGSQIRWPVREMAMLLNLACCVCFLIWNRKGHRKGIILPTYFVFYGIYRFFELLLKSADYSLMNAEDFFFVVLSLLLGMLFLMILDEQKKKEESFRKEGSQSKRKSKK